MAVSSQGSDGRIIRRTYYNIFPVKKEPLVIQQEERSIPEPYISRNDLMRWFTSGGVRFPEESKLLYYPNKTNKYHSTHYTLDLWNTKSNLDLIDRILRNKLENITGAPLPYMRAVKFCLIRVDGPKIGNLQMRNTSFDEFIEAIPQKRLNVLYERIIRFHFGEPTIIKDSGNSFSFNFFSPNLHQDFDGRSDFTKQDIRAKYMSKKEVEGFECFYIAHSVEYEVLDNYDIAHTDEYPDIYSINLICKLHFGQEKAGGMNPLSLDFDTEFSWKRGELEKPEILLCYPSMQNKKRTEAKQPVCYYFTIAFIELPFYKCWGEEYENLNQDIKRIRNIRWDHYRKETGNAERAGGSE